MHDGITCHMGNGTMYHETRRDARGTVHWGQSVMAYTRHLPLLLCFSNSNYQYTRFTPFFRVCPHARTRPRLVTRNRL